MKARIALAGAFAAIIAAVAAPTVAHAGPNDNANARVAGVASRPASDGCGLGNFCIYTNRDYSGRVFWLPRCSPNYSLSNWNGVGSYLNNNSGGAFGYIKDANGRNLVISNPDASAGSWGNPAYNFKPAWYVHACTH